MQQAGWKSILIGTQPGSQSTRPSRCAILRHHRRHNLISKELLRPARCTCPVPMPPWVASVPRLTTCARARAIDRFATSLRCPHVTSPLRSRPASTHVSPTAINYRPNVPPKNEELYNTLSGLNGAAEQYVNLSRLQLALRGLAVEDAVTRVAVLGLNSQVGAQRLARLLVADPLAEKAEWERELEKDPEEGAVLLR